MSIPSISATVSPPARSTAHPTDQAAQIGKETGLSPDARQNTTEELQKLKKTDAAVRQHEQAHIAVAGGLAQSGASFTYQRGPDGQLYAVGGEVSIDVSPAATPTETIAKARQIRAAALAPADPSAQDRAVAAEASLLEAQARTELAQQQPTASSGASNKAAGLYQVTAAQTGIPLSSLIAVA